VSLFAFLRETVAQRLNHYVAKNGGADRFLFMGPKVTISMQAQLRFHSSSYAFDVTSTTDIRFVFVDEQIGYRSVEGAIRKGSIRQGHEVSTWAESVLEERLRDPRLPDIDRQVCRDIYDSLSGLVIYHVHDTSDTAPIRRSCSVRDYGYLRPDGANLAVFLHFLDQKHPDAYHRIVDTVRLVAPFFNDFWFDPKEMNGDLMLQLEWTQRGSDHHFHVSQLSDGTLRFIALATALLQPNPPATMLFDEPELGLHPYALNLLAALLQSTAIQTQIIVSTQSAPLLDNFQPEDIIVVEREDGASTFKRQSSAELAEWLKNYSLGELWQKNVIGGRPSDG
jgi:predicted ATPase